MTLRNLLFCVIDVAFNTPRVVTLLVGAYGYHQGWVSPRARSPPPCCTSRR